MSAFLLALRDDPDFRLTHRWLALAADLAVYAAAILALEALVVGVLLVWGGVR